MSIILADVPLLISFKQAAEILGASEGQVRQLVRAKRLTAVYVGKRLMIRSDAIPTFVEHNTTVQPASTTVPTKGKLPLKVKAF